MENGKRKMLREKTEMENGKWKDEEEKRKRKWERVLPIFELS